VASIIGIITALFLFSYNNPLNQMADIVSALIMILLGFYDYKKIKSSIEKPWIFVLIFIILVIVLVFLSGATS